MTKSSLEIAGRTDSGCVRPNNEDNFLIDSALGLVAVADGMGGHNSGEVASELAMQTLHKTAQELSHVGVPAQFKDASPGLSRRGKQLEYLVKTANEVIYNKGRELTRDAGMGTTVVAAFIDDASLTVANVGDSRLYLWRSGRLSQLTEDHSLVSDQLRLGLITAEQAQRSTLQNILTRAVGAEETVAVDVVDKRLRPGDVVLLASDGLSKMVPDATVACVIEQEGAPQLIVDQLISLARDAGGIDNVTVVCVRVPMRTMISKVNRFLSLFSHGR